MDVLHYRLQTSVVSSQRKHTRRDTSTIFGVSAGGVFALHTSKYPAVEPFNQLSMRSMENKENTSPLRSLEEGSAFDLQEPSKYEKVKALPTQPWQAIGYLAIWYFFSTSATFNNKVLIKKHHISAELLTLCHLLVSVICDYVVLTLPGSRSASSWKLQRVDTKRIIWILPLSLFSFLSKVLTYWSYDAVPISIAHTCKASQPFFNVILAFIAYRTTFSLRTYMTLVPIVVGVIMASVSEMGMNDLAVGGVIFAVVAAMLGVMQSMYAKFLLRRKIVIDSINLHFYGAFLSLALNTPFVMYNLATSNTLPESFPYVTILGCSLMQFVGTFCSSLLLGEVTELTFSIMSTMKRVVIILSAVFYFGNPVSFQSVSGMVMAVGGVAAYQYVKLNTISSLSALPQTIADAQHRH